MSSDEILFETSYHGDPVTVTHATADEIEVFAGPVGPTIGEAANDILELWSLIAMRSGAEIEIHALGWRLLLANTWITSPLVAVNLTEGAVRTRSGKVYLLGVQDRPELNPELHAHLAYALETWGFENVRPR